MPTALEFYDQATLSLVAYATLPSGTPRVNELTKPEVGMTQAQAEMFASTDANGWTVLAQFTDPITGASATVFEHGGNKYLAVRGTEASLADLTADYLLAFGVPSQLNPQYLALTLAVSAWMQPGNVLESGTCTITGHSLGGYLALALKCEYPDKIADVYMYNAPGVGGIFTDLGTFMSAAFGLTPSTNIPATGVWNIKGSEGLSLITGLGHQVGTIVNMPIESASGTAPGNHSIVKLTDSLAVYSLLGRLDPALDVKGYGKLFEAAADESEKSLERVVDYLQKLLLDPTSADSKNLLPTGNDAVARDELFKAIYGLMNLGTNGNPTGTFGDLAGKDVIIDGDGQNTKKLNDTHWRIAA